MHCNRLPSPSCEGYLNPRQGHRGGSASCGLRWLKGCQRRELDEGPWGPSTPRPNAISRERSVRRFAQDDDFVEVLKKHKLVLMGPRPVFFLPMYARANVGLPVQEGGLPPSLQPLLRRWIALIRFRRANGKAVESQADQINDSLLNGHKTTSQAPDTACKQTAHQGK